MSFFPVSNPDELLELVNEVGFLPFFKNEIEGFSLEEHTAPGFWFNDDVEGPWEWKATLSKSQKCAYGKCFDKKAGYVSLKWYPHLANYRRCGYDFDAKYDDGLVSMDEKRVMDTLLEYGPLLSFDLKKLSHCQKSFDSIMTKLQMQTYVTSANFEYRVDKHGNQYGWGVGRYAISEQWLGEETCIGQYDIDSKESFEMIIDHLIELMPYADEKKLRRFMR
ncbi:MAG: hypothetical protein IJF16_11760 [Clostridia bacterium]|nr:hypothetical protein [Clostridia bacterium]